MIRIFATLLTLILTLNGHAATKMRYPGGKQYMYRLTLTDKRESPFTLDHPTRWLSAKSVERRRRQGLALDSTDLPVSPRYLKVIQSQRDVSIEIGRASCRERV